MTHPTRRMALIGAATALPLFHIKPGRAAETVFKYGNSLQAGNPLTTYVEQAAKHIAEDTNGRLQIQTYPAAALGGDTDMLSQLRTGGLECVTLASGVFSSLVPQVAINEVPFAFKDAQTVFRAMDGDVGALVRAAIGKMGLMVLDRMWDSGFRQITTSRRPIVTPADLAGLKIRVPVFQLATSMFSTLGASPVSINSSEMYSALQTKIADGQENSLTNIDTFKLYEIQTYCSMTNHMWDGYWFLFNAAAWGRLPKDVQAIVTKHLNAAPEAERDEMEKLNNGMRATLEKRGMKFNDVDIGPFREKLRTGGFYADWSKRFGDQLWTALETYAGKLA